MDDRVIGFDGVTEYLTAKQERALGHLQTYYGPFRPRFRKTTKKGFTGRFYDDRVAASAAAPDHFTVDDFLAPSLLSTSLSGDAVASLLAIREDLDEALGKCPPRDFALADATDDQLATDAPLDVLYWKIRQINGLGPTRASKLLAAKRPHLIPVRDSKVSSILGNPRQWWTPWRDLIRTDELQDALDPIRAAAGATLPKAISMLRLLDVILWCEADQRHLQASRRANAPLADRVDRSASRRAGWSGEESGSSAFSWPSKPGMRSTRTDRRDCPSRIPN